MATVPTISAAALPTARCSSIQILILLLTEPHLVWLPKLLPNWADYNKTRYFQLFLLQ